MKIPCTNCNQHLEIPEGLAGQTIECPACNASLAVPSPELPPPSTPQSVRFCSKCGTEQKENAKFCHSCGHTLTETQPSKASSPKESKSPIPKWAIAAVVGVVIVVVALIMFFPDGSNGVLPSEPPDISIHEAAENGNIKAVKQHLAAGTDVNAKDKQLGGTPLHSAAGKGHKEVAELLIANGADVNAKDRGGFMPLDEAIINENTEIVDLLRKHDGKSGAEDSIQVAASVGTIEAVKQHLAAGADVNAKDDWGMTPLHRTAEMGRKEIAELLIAKGADVNAKGWKGATPLHRAANKEIAELLITAGANVNAKPNGGWTPLYGAANKEIAELLIASGAGVNVKGDEGWTPLHAAVQQGNKEFAELLISKGAGADVNAKDVNGETLLDLAVLFDHSEIAELLIANGADVNVKANDGTTPLDMADDKETADVLRKHGGKTGEELKAVGK